MKTIPNFLTASLFLVGCASTTPMALGPEHPGSADAPVAPLPPPSATLAVSATPTTAGGTDAPVHSGHGADGAGHSEHGAGHAYHGASATTHPHATEGASGKPQALPLYACPMHAKVVADKPGRCPECRMNLVKKEVAR